MKLREVAIVLLNEVEGEVFYHSVPTPVRPSLRWQSLQWRGQMSTFAVEAFIRNNDYCRSPAGVLYIITNSFSCVSFGP